VLKGRLDPVMIFDLNDAKQELRRRGKVPPAKDQEMSERDYLEACIQVTNTIPLPSPPLLSLPPLPLILLSLLSHSLSRSPAADPLTELTTVA